MPRAGRVAIVAVALVIAVAVLLLFVLFPSGASTAAAAATEPVRERADRGTVRVLVSQRWGDGELVLVRFDLQGERMLRLAFASKGLRGWRTAGATEQRADLTDVAVGSMVVARSAGGKGQPPWSAAAGELGDRRIRSVEIRWIGGITTTGARRSDSYLVVQQGSLQVESARFLGRDGVEIAMVPVSRR